MTHSLPRLPSAAVAALVALSLAGPLPAAEARRPVRRREIQGRHQGGQQVGGDPEARHGDEGQG